jgi:hypothetical protein
MFKLPLIKTPDNKAKSLCDPNFNIFHLSFIYLSSIFHLFSTKKSSHVVTFKAAFFRGENGVSSQATRGGSVACNVESYCWGISV